MVRKSKALIGSLLILSLLFTPALFGKKKKSFADRHELSKVRKIAVIPFCPVKKKMKSKKYRQLARAASFFTNHYLDREVFDSDIDVKVLSYRKLRKRLKKLGYKYKCRKIYDYKRLAERLGVDTIVTGKLLKAVARNESGAEDAILSPLDALTEQTVKVKIRFYVYRKGKLIAKKQVTTIMEGDIISNALAGGIVADAFDILRIREKYKKYLPPLAKAASRFARWLVDKFPED